MSWSHCYCVLSHSMLLLDVSLLCCCMSWYDVLPLDMSRVVVWHVVSWRVAAQHVTCHGTVHGHVMVGCGVLCCAQHVMVLSLLRVVSWSSAQPCWVGSGHSTAGGHSMCVPQPHCSLHNLVSERQKEKEIAHCGVQLLNISCHVVAQHGSAQHVHCSCTAA